MFNCGKCGKPVGPCISPVRHVTERRSRIYRVLNVIVSKGWEIVKEINLCPQCAQEEGVA